MATLQALQSVACSRRDLFDFDGGGKLVGAVSCGKIHRRNFNRRDTTTFFAFIATLLAISLTAIAANWFSTIFSSKMRLRINNSVIEGVLFVVIAVIYGVDFGFGERLTNIADEVL